MGSGLQFAILFGSFNPVSMPPSGFEHQPENCKIAGLTP